MELVAITSAWLATVVARNWGINQQMEDLLSIPPFNNNNNFFHTLRHFMQVVRDGEEAPLEAENTNRAQQHLGKPTLPSLTACY